MILAEGRIGSQRLFGMKARWRHERPAALRRAVVVKPDIIFELHAVLKTTIETIAIRACRLRPPNAAQLQDYLLAKPAPIRSTRRPGVGEI